MPASNPRALAKGPALSADAIIIDLEDSVAVEAKPEARQQALEALNTQDYGRRLRVLRINGLDTPWIDDDMALLEHIRPDAILLPKVESAEHIERLSQSLDSVDSKGELGIWAMMETPAAVLAAGSIANISKQLPRLSAFCVGNNDLARASGMPLESSRGVLMPWLMTFLAAAKAHGLLILDGVYNNFRDMEGFHAECVEGASIGMDGKTLIHPTQIQVANTAFSPNDVQLREALAIVDAFALAENARAGAIQINGRMVERLHLEMAEHTLALAEQLTDTR